MHMKFRGVNPAFKFMVELIADDGKGALPLRRSPSRYGDVIVCDEPVTITYNNPRERVLFNEARDANPFFHIYEALWMLVGRNDVAPLLYYNSRMKEFSDDGKTLNGAYGRRWRGASGPPKLIPEGCEQPRGYYREGVDQLKVIINHLRDNPTSRRAVLQMWNVEDDLLRIGGKCTCGADRSGPSAEAHDRDCAEVTGSKDVACNLSVMFSLREVPEHYGNWERQGNLGPDNPLALDMTVTNRSNDMVWGMLGANFVHFTFLQEYVAAALGVEVGRYHHFTNNLHAYTDPKRWEPEKWLRWYCEAGNDNCEWEEFQGYGYKDSQTEREIQPGIALVKDRATFDAELPEFVERFSKNPHGGGMWREPFLATVAQPALLAYHYGYKEHTEGYPVANSIATHWLNMIAADDWRVACTSWIKRRWKKWQEQGTTTAP
jgi:thymidylate synthase